MSCGTTSVGMKRGREDGDAEDCRQVKKPRTEVEEEERRVERELFGELSEDEVDDAAGEDVAEDEEGKKTGREEDFFGEDLSEEEQDAALKEGFAEGRMDSLSAEKKGPGGEIHQLHDASPGENPKEQRKWMAGGLALPKGYFPENDGLGTWEIALPKQVLHQQKEDDDAASVALQEPDEDDASEDGLLYVLSEEELQEMGRTWVERAAKEKEARLANDILLALQEEEEAEDREAAAFLALSCPVEEDDVEGDDAADDGLLEVVSEEESQEIGSTREESAAEERQDRPYDDLVLSLQENEVKGVVGEEESLEMGRTREEREAEDADARVEELAQLALEELEAEEWEASMAAASAFSVEDGLPTPPTSQPQSDTEGTVPQSRALVASSQTATGADSASGCKGKGAKGGRQAEKARPCAQSEASEGSSPASPEDDDDDSAPGRKRKGKKEKNGAEVDAVTIRNTIAATSVFTGRKRRCWETCVQAPTLSDRLPVPTASEATTTQTSLPPVTGENAAPIDLTAPTKRERKALLKQQHEERKAIREREFAEKYVVPIPVDVDVDAPAPTLSQEEFAAKYGSIPTLREQAGHEAEAHSHPEGHVKEKRAKKAANMARWRASQKRH